MFLAGLDVRGDLIMHIVVCVCVCRAYDIQTGHPNVLPFP